MPARGLERFPIADAPVGRAVRPAVAFLHGVDPSKFERIQAELFGELIHHRLGRKRGVGRAGRAIGCRARLVDQDIVTVNLQILQPIRRKNGGDGRANRRAGVRAGFVGQSRQRRRDAPAPVRAELDRI
jgi:hypothetical protein